MSRRLQRPVLIGASLLLTTLGLFDTLVLLPGALAPSSRLAAVWTSIAMRGDLVPVLVGPVLWTSLCVVFAARLPGASHRSSLPRGLAVALLGLGAIALLHQIAGFGMGLWLSNHLPPFEGGSTALSDAIALTGAVTIVAGLLALAVGAGPRRKQGSAA